MLSQIIRDRDSEKDTIRERQRKKYKGIHICYSQAFFVIILLNLIFSAKHFIKIHPKGEQIFINI